MLPTFLSLEQGIYDCKNHPKFRSGEWTERQCLRSFLLNFDSPGSEKDAEASWVKKIDFEGNEGNERKIDYCTKIIFYKRAREQERDGGNQRKYRPEVEGKGKEGEIKLGLRKY